MPQIIRTRLTWFLYLQLTVFGYFMFSISPAMTLLGDDQHTSDTVIGSYSLVFSLGVISTGLWGHRIVAKLGRRSTLWCSTGAICCGLLLFCSTGPIPVTLAGTYISGHGASLLANVIVAALTTIHGQSAPRAITESNTLASAAGVIAPLVLGLAIMAGIDWRWALLVALPCFAFLALNFGRVPLPEAKVALSVASDGPLGAGYWRAWVAMVVCNAPEFSLVIWSSEVLRSETGAGQGTSALAATAVLLGITVGRMIGASLVSRYPVDILLYTALTILVAGFVVFWISTLLWLSFVALFVAGLGVSMQYPLTLSRVIAAGKHRPDLAANRVSLGFGISRGIAPFAIGALSDLFGAHNAMLLIPVVVGLAAIAIWSSGRAAPSPPKNIDAQKAPARMR